MKNLLQKIPFLRLSLFFSIGIILHQWIHIPRSIYFTLILLFFLFQIYLNRKFKFHYSIPHGLSIHILFIFIGILVSQQYNKSPYFYENGSFIAIVLEKPIEKNNSFKSEIEITAFCKNDSVFKTKEKVLVYFQKSEKVVSLQAGQKIIFNQSPQFVTNNKNPFEFDYQSYLARKKIYRRIYLSGNSWQMANEKAVKTLKTLAEKSREHLLSIYRKQNLGENQFQILSALTLGYKRELDPEIKKVFSAAGAMHVLAVSGLHVGILYWMITFFVGFMRNKAWGKPFFILLPMTCLWLYALLTGFSPSVARAATMFSFIIVGNSLKKPSNIYNTLAASMFILLLINPNNIFEVGFQLSYSAVFGIVYLHPKIYKLIEIKTSLLKKIWELLSVSIAAQITTFPIVIYYFNQFPIYFLLTNLIVIPSVFILIPSGILLMLVSPFPIIANHVSVFIKVLIQLVYTALEKIEGLPFSILQISINDINLVFLVMSLLLLFIFLANKKSNSIIASLTFLLLLFLSTFYSNTKELKHKQIIIYSTNTGPLLHLITSRKNYVISEILPEPESFEAQFYNQTRIKMNLYKTNLILAREPFCDNYIFSKNGFVFFENKIILIHPSAKTAFSNLVPDIVINPLNQCFAKKTIITVKDVKFQNISKNTSVFYTQKQGAFQEKWEPLH